MQINIYLDKVITFCKTSQQMNNSMFGNQRKNRQLRTKKRKRTKSKRENFSRE